MNIESQIAELLEERDSISDKKREIASSLMRNRALLNHHRKRGDVERIVEIENEIARLLMEREPLDVRKQQIAAALGRLRARHRYHTVIAPAKETARVESDAEFLARVPRNENGGYNQYAMSLEDQERFADWTLRNMRRPENVTHPGTIAPPNDTPAETVDQPAGHHLDTEDQWGDLYKEIFPDSSAE